MGDSDLLALFADYRDGLDSVPYAHETELNSAVAAFVPATPGQGAGCPLVLAAGVVALLFVAVVVAQIVMAVTR